MVPPLPASEASLSVGQLRREQQLILNSVGEGIYSIDVRGNVVFINPKCAQLTGYDPDELIGRPAHETIHHTRADGSAHPVEECPIYAALRDGATRRISNDVFWRKDGRSFRVEYIAAAVKDDAGKITGSLVTFRDATERIVTDARLQLQAEQYQLLFRTHPSPMWIFDGKTSRILAANQAAVAQYGYSREEFLELTVVDLNAPETNSSSAEQTNFSGEVRHARKDGSIIFVHLYSGPIIWDSSSACVVTAIDITERKKMEETLRASRAQLETIVENLDEGVVVSDLDGNLLHWNSAALRLHGYTKEDHRNLTALVDTFELHELDGAAVSVDAWPLARILRDEPVRDWELRVRNKKVGLEKIFSYGGTLVRDETGKAHMAVVTIRDVTERIPSADNE